MLPLLGVLALAGVALFGLAVVLALRVRARREQDWRELAAARGLVHVDGDPLGLGDVLRSRVRSTAQGTVGGVPVALLAEVVPGGDGPDPTTPVVLVRLQGVDASRVVLDRRCTLLHTPQHGDLLVLRPPVRFRGAGSTATAAEAAALLDELLTRLGPGSQQ